MTDKDSSHNFNPKHRIIGAVVIVALTVIFVPWILGEPQPPAQSRVPEPNDVPEPAAEASTSENKVAITVVTPPVAGSANDVPPASVTLAQPAVAKEPPKVVESRPAAVATKPATTAKATTVTNGWIVQVGTFSNTENASRVEQKLRSLGQPVKAERVNISGGKAVRVRVGPFADKNVAVKAQDRIQKEMGIQVVVLSYP
jgi:DedD protein